jgi:hypothetical protein
MKYADFTVDDTHIAPSAIAIRADRLILISSQGDCKFVDLSVNPLI